MGARLGIALLSLGVALGLEAAGEDFTTAEWRGFYATIGFAFLATIAYGLVLHRVVRPLRFAALNVVTDIVIVTALVYFSGGYESVFSFLYVLVAAYGAFLFDTRGAVGTTLLASASYGMILFLGHRGWAPSIAMGPPVPEPVLATAWLVNGAAVATVAMLANRLTVELLRTGEALTQRTSDLRKLQNLHQSTVKSLMSGLLTCDLDGRVTSLNPEAERITGICEEAVLGHDVEDVIPGIRTLAIANVGDDESQGSRSRTPYVNERGENLHLGLAAYVLKDGDGTASGHVVIFQDVTAVVQMERELRRSERLAAVGELSASIAHEVRNPLAAISGSVQILQQRAGEPWAQAENRQLMDIVIRETDRLNRLITDFLQYARPGPRKPETVVVAEAVEDVVKMFDAVRPTGVEIELELEDGLQIDADAAQLRQLLWNLVLNAAEAMPDGGPLRIHAAMLPAETPQGAAEIRRNGELKPKPAGRAEILVSDRGVGIPGDVLERIFDPFVTTKANGSGLGLAAVHRIVEDHGGIVRLESKVGEGTTVQLNFPQARVAQ
jgi:two-component system sensor histidine kinase PilS (NtrC family)